MIINGIFNEVYKFFEGVGKKVAKNFIINIIYAKLAKCTVELN